jgi:hypothetical protein
VETHNYFYRSFRRLQGYFLYRKLLKSGQKIFISTAGRTDLLMLNLAAKGTISQERVYFYFHWLNSKASKLRSLKKIAARQPNLVILGPTATVVDVFKQCGFKNASVVPYPITQRDTNEVVGQGEFRYLLYAGAARQDKGFSYVVDFIEYLSHEKLEIPIVIQTSAEHLGKCDAATSADIERLKQIRYSGLTLKTEVLSSREYAELFVGAITIQLYNVNDFSDRISGITLDAFTAGCPVISNSGTWIARMVERFDAGLVIDAVAPQEVFKCASAIISNYAHYNANAIKAGQILQKENNASTLYRVLAK